jgi:hypothetical protein
MSVPSADWSPETATMRPFASAIEYWTAIELRA